MLESVERLFATAAAGGGKPAPRGQDEEWREVGGVFGLWPKGGPDGDGDGVGSGAPQGNQNARKYPKGEEPYKLKPLTDLERYYIQKYTDEIFRLDPPFRWTGPGHLGRWLDPTLDRRLYEQQIANEWRRYLATLLDQALTWGDPVDMGRLLREFPLPNWANDRQQGTIMAIGRNLELLVGYAKRHGKRAVRALINERRRHRGWP